MLNPYAKVDQLNARLEEAEAALSTLVPRVLFAWEDPSGQKYRFGRHRGTLRILVQRDGEWIFYQDASVELKARTLLSMQYVPAARADAILQLNNLIDTALSTSLPDFTPAMEDPDA